MELTYFKDDQECLEKLIELKIVSKTSKLTKLDDLKYKQIDSQKVIEYKCKVLGFASKYTSPQCHDSIYQNLLVSADNRTFNINIDHFTSMQKKSFGINNEIIEE